MATTWFIQQNQKTVGPLSSQQLKELVVAGKLRGDDLVRKGEDGQFMPASKIKNLFADDTNNSRPVPPPLPSAESQWHSSATTTPDLSSDASLLFDSDVMPLPKSSGPSSPASSWLNRLLPYWTAGQKSLKDFGHQASQAGELGKLYALQTRIQQIQLPQAYTALGVDVYGERRFADAFKTLYSEIDEVVSQQSALATTVSPERKSDDLKGKVKDAAEGVLRRGKGAKLGLKVRSLQSKLGETAYVKYDKECGPLQLIAPIKSAQEELERLKQRIAGLAAANTGRELTPKRLLIGGGIVAFVVLIGLLPTAVQQPREAARKAQAEHQSEKNRNGSALTADAPATIKSTELKSVSSAGYFSTPYTHVTLPASTISKVHKISVSEFKGRTTDEVLSFMPLRDIRDVTFSKGKNGEPIELFIVSTADGKLDQEAHFYTDAVTGKPVFHGTVRTYHKNEKLAGCYLYVWGQLKCFSKWKSNGSPTQFDVYLGDEDHRRYSFFYYDSSPAGPYTLSSMESQRCTHVQGEEGHEVYRRSSDGLRVELDEDGDVWRKSIWRNTSGDNRVKDSVSTGLTVIRKKNNQNYTQGLTVSHDPRDQMVLVTVLDVIRRLRDDQRP